MSIVRFVPVVRPVVAVVRGVVPVRACERVLMIDVVVLEGLRVLVRAMVEWFESKGVGGGCYSCGIKATK